MSFKISVQNLGKRYNREWIFRGLSYTFESGNIYAITGQNGSGKSTLLQILWGQVPPSSGSIKYVHNNKEVDMDSIFRHVSIAAPYMDLIDEFTLKEQLRFHFRLKPAKNDLTIEQVADHLRLADSLDKFVGNFSSGTKQRIKLGLAFFTQADILFLDEPGTNLDAITFEWYLAMLANTIPKSLTLIASNQPAEYPLNASKIDIMTYK